MLPRTSILTTVAQTRALSEAVSSSREVRYTALAAAEQSISGHGGSPKPLWKNWTEARLFLFLMLVTPASVDRGARVAVATFS